MVSNSGNDYNLSLSISGSANNNEREEHKSVSIQIPAQKLFNSNQRSEEVKE